MVQNMAPVDTINVLYIEDNFINVRLVTRMLRQTCYEVSWADSVEGGIALAIREHPDVIILDMHIPEVNGYDALKLIKAHDDLKFIPTIVLTADPSELLREKCMALGVDDYQFKPISRQRLLQSLDTITQKRA
ncbi:MAG: response regulator [Anaerolineae bacterium]|nr:response regulator [Anaerolineae bacterium]MCA9893269.1 response regulator [Anaerolineae bacterium]MCB9461230.1 response regulator [Anaerolineaceae bacterium]